VAFVIGFSWTVVGLTRS